MKSSKSPIRTIRPIPLDTLRNVTGGGFAKDASNWLREQSEADNRSDRNYSR